ncbi:MAG: DegT/DnrJ/EryC1/StrS family aminotransferase, partial [Pseudomonadota bacterium]|nr:DegT/DnrJ/EryC1/StrS family aminotransferase [Pseudomonadota bacterium]
FEDNFCKFTGAKYALAVSSCTAALHLALNAISIKKGDKVIVPSLTFTASAEVITYFQAVPIFVDIDYDTCLITPEIIQKVIDKHGDIKAVIVVHLAGHPAMMTNDNQKGILDICKENNITVIEDAAHAFPSKLNNTYVGNFGKITCFSFYANKTITTGEGGMIVSDDEKLIEKIKVMRLHGIDKDPWKRQNSGGTKWKYDVITPGFKYNMPDINAAIGLAQLEKAEKMRLERQRCAEYYAKHLSEIECIEIPKLKVSFSDHSWHLYLIVVNDKSNVSRDELMNLLETDGISTSLHYIPLHQMTYYKETYNLDNQDFPNTERYFKGCLSLPIYPSLKNEELEHIVKSIKKHCVKK